MTIDQSCCPDQMDQAEEMKMESRIANKYSKNFKRRSSLEKIMYICNQSYSAFPHVFLWLQDFQQTVSVGFRKMIPLIKSLFLAVGVYLGIFIILAQTFFCIFSLLRFPAPLGLIFLSGCIAVLGIITYKSLAPVSKKTERLIRTSKKLN